MCYHYRIYFDVSNLKAMKSFLRQNSEKKIYTDHFTKYSVDIIRDYKKDSESKRIQGKDFEFDEVNNGDWILYNKKHVAELEMQKYTFPDFSTLRTKKFERVALFNDFIFYEKIR
jgi:hypothetical protein